MGGLERVIHPLQQLFPQGRYRTERFERIRRYAKERRKTVGLFPITEESDESHHQQEFGVGKHMLLLDVIEKGKAEEYVLEEFRMPFFALDQPTDKEGKLRGDPPLCAVLPKRTKGGNGASGDEPPPALPFHEVDLRMRKGLERIAQA